MSSSSAFSVVGVDGAALEGANSVLHKAGFIERIGVNRHLYVQFVGDRQRAINSSGRFSPVFMEFEPDSSGQNLFAQRAGKRSIALAEKTEINRQALAGFHHPVNIPRSGSARCGIGSGSRARAASDQRRQARRKSGPDQLGTNKMNVRINATGGDYLSFTREHFGARTYGHSWSDASHDVGIAGLANRCDPAAADSDVRLHDSPVVNNHGVRNHKIESARLRGSRSRLTHTIPHYLAAAKFGFITGCRE